MADLKPCPCCDARDDQIETVMRAGFWKVKCWSCGLTGIGSSIKSVAVAAWNRRAPLPEPTGAEVGAVEKIVERDLLSGNRKQPLDYVIRAALRAFVAKQNGGGS